MLQSVLVNELNDLPKALCVHTCSHVCVCVFVYMNLPNALSTENSKLSYGQHCPNKRMHESASA